VLIAGAGDFSFDWDLVQPSIARFTRACSYDRAGAAWSDVGPTPRTMKQEAYELRLLLRTAGIKPPYVLVGHSLGGLIARVYASEFRGEVAGVVLVDSTHEDTTLFLSGKLVRMRTIAKARPIPDVQTMKSSPPKRPSPENGKEAEESTKLAGPAKIGPPFNKLPSAVQEMHLWFRSHPNPSVPVDDYFAEELQAMFEARAKTEAPLGDIPLVVMIPADRLPGSPPPGVSADEWKRVNEEKRVQKVGFTGLSRNSKLVVAEKSGHHIQLDEPGLVIEAVRQVVDAARRGAKLTGTKPSGN
jgi:pimeloyl-ACP methyl ester carboxylesterase